MNNGFTRFAAFAILLVVASLTASYAQQKAHLQLSSPHASYVQGDFPFFSQTVDARKWGSGWPADNLTPRGMVFSVGNNTWAVFDIDLLRVAAVWQANAEGEYLSMVSMSAGSYRHPYRKAPAGQKVLPEPIGSPVLANGRYPGWSVGTDEPALKDPRSRGSAEANEPGLGALPSAVGEWRGIVMKHGMPHLQYRIGDAEIEERFGVGDDGQARRWIAVQPHQADLLLVHGQTVENGHPVTVAVPASQTVQLLSVALHTGASAFVEHLPDRRAYPFAESWRYGAIDTPITPSAKSQGYVYDQAAMPVPNTWKRNVRISAFDFYKDGRAAVVTFDGDVWMVTGMTRNGSELTWRRFAAGLHEPIGLSIVDEQLYIFGRNGIVRLHDDDRDGVADRYENFCSLFGQTAETREFAMDIVPKLGGGFYIAKGGQVAATRGKHHGTIIEVSADGTSYEVIATGFRQPYLGVHPKTGYLTASDQQGHWKPATPIYSVERGGYYGFQPAKYGAGVEHPAPVKDPAIWIPHFVNQSGASQVWLLDSVLEALNGSMLHVGYFRPEVFKVYFDTQGTITQGAVVPIVGGFDCGLLKPRVNPLDGSVWLSGFEIWGSVGGPVSGLYRLRFAGGPQPLPNSIRAEKRGVYLRFDQPLNPTVAADVKSYTVDRWQYKRSHAYGSGHYRLDGTPGQETVPVASVTLSRDRQGIFIGIPDIKPVDSMRISYRSGLPFTEPRIDHAYLTIHQLGDIDLVAEGFDSNEVDLELLHLDGAAAERPEPSAALGKQLYQQFGCVACHTVDGSRPKGPEDQAAQIAVGPSWKGLWNARRDFTDGTSLRNVDETYLRESIVDPGKRVAKGFETSKTGVGMPSYLGVLKDHEIDSIIRYIEALR